MSSRDSLLQAMQCNVTGAMNNADELYVWAFNHIDTDQDWLDVVEVVDVLCDKRLPVALARFPLNMESRTHL